MVQPPDPSPTQPVARRVPVWVKVAACITVVGGALVGLGVGMDIIIHLHM